MAKLILVPGLSDETRLFEFAADHFFRKRGIKTMVHAFGWKDKSTGFEAKLESLLAAIDAFAGKENIALAGSSAGASASFNAYYLRKNKVVKLINICGRLSRAGSPSLEWAARDSLSFFDSVISCEKGLARLTAEDRKKILTMRPLYDEIVPSFSVPVGGARNIRIISIEHMLSGALSLTLYSGIISGFIKD
ncbi:MAG: hypothetical protein HGA85_07490 [Nanoarchaeota archaeon]|nr:hypothetical protein [Nanoarchaeota archaeon]